ncbi:helix-turn-helix transcriptional regulator [Helcococcus ovis]|uniref:helix-turn-helix domain-containing protein n=2 Tax=Peptoniphilaceae TaxID=1570339 RepID=UPI0038B80F60
MSLGKLIKKFRELRRITQKALGDRIHLDDVRIRQYELDIRTPKDDVLEKISAVLHVNKEYLKEPDYPYTEHDLMRFLFKLDDSIKVKIRPVILNDEDPEYTTTGIYFGSEAILRIRNMLEQWQEIKEKYENNEITKEALQDLKANYPDSLKKNYVPFEKSNIKRFHNSMSVKVPPEIK